MSFHEIQFPPKISYGSTGGPRRKTEVVELASGHEERNSPWSQSRRTYNVAYGIKSVDDLHDVMGFFEAREAALYGFRYKDWSDYKSVRPLETVTPTDQVLGTGTGALTTFQLVKVYSDVANTQTRIITKPVSGTVRVSLNGVEQLAGWLVDTTTGVVVFSVAPALGVIVRAGFEFDVPVRFGNDQLTINLSHFEMGSLPDISLVEVRV